MKKELQEKNQQQQQPKQSLMDLELADYEKTIKTLKDDLNNKDKDIQELNSELTSLKEKITGLQQEIENLEQQKSQTEERANKFKSLFDTTKKELQDAKDLEQERHHNDGNVRSLIDQLQIDLDNNKALLSQITSEKQQLNGKFFRNHFPNFRFCFLLDRLNSQTDTNQRTIQLLEQNLRIAKHELDVAKQD
jgi:DNA repair exonuclease SbcCD ATPase subunit